jgi:lambda family phage minor tail protein L
MAVPFSELQAVAPSAVIELFVLELNAVQHGVNATYRFHAGTSLNANGELVWAGNTYQRFPIEADGFEYSGKGQLPRPKLRVSNILGYVTGLLAELPSGLQGAKVTRIRTLARYLDAVNFPPRQNLFTNTNLFVWTETATSPGPQVRYRQANAALAPDGTMTATKLVSSTDNDNQRIYRSTTGVVANSPVTYSFYAKAGEYTKVSIRASAVATANSVFDLVNGVWVVNSNATSQFAIDAGNDWYRIGITYTPTTTTTVPWVQLVNSANVVTFSGNGTSGLFIWGAQLEVGNVATDYQPSVGIFINAGGSNPYQVSTNPGWVPTLNTGQTLNDASSSLFDGLDAVQTPTGYDLLLIGTGTRAGQYFVYNTNDAGLITGNSGWQTAAQAISLGWNITYPNFPQPAGASQNPYGTPDATAEFPQEIYYIDRKSTETRDVVEFELAAAFDLQGVRAPKRQCISSICQWVYRSPECSYNAPAYYDADNNPIATAALDVCGKRIDSCETRFDVYTRIGTVTQGSNVLTLNTSVSILPGQPVRGYGLPAGTTVLAILTPTTIRVSNNATATTGVTVTGTPSGSDAFMTVTSNTGIGVGHLVTGPYMNGATVTGISGTTITLSQRPYELVKDGIYQEVAGDDWIDIASGTTGISVGMFAYGSFGVNKPVVVVEPTRVRIDTVTDIKAAYETVAARSGGFLPWKRNIATSPVVAYFVPQTPAAASYIFTADQTYAFRDPLTALPFGSFPGVGGAYV